MQGMIRHSPNINTKAKESRELFSESHPSSTLKYIRSYITISLFFSCPLNQAAEFSTLKQNYFLIYFVNLRCLFHTLQMKNGNEFLLTDTVGFIQKLPTMLVRFAATR